MAKDAEGRKFQRIPSHTRTVKDKEVLVRAHVRSNRTDSKGEA